MSDFLMPSLGADMDSGTLLEWQVRPGDTVRKGQVVAVVEIAKGAIDIEVFEDGVVEELYVEEGSEVPVGTPLARIAAAGTTPAAEAAETTDVEEAAAPAEDDDAGKLTTEPAATHTSRTREVDEQPPQPTASPRQRESASARASPAARKMALEAGLNLAEIKGSGPGGVIVLEDVKQASTRARPESHAAKPAFDRSEMRQAIAGAMSRSKREIPHYYLANTVDLHAATRWLDTYNTAQPPEARLLMAALFMKACARALKRYPELNGHYEQNTFVPIPSINLGMAINLRGGGLVAPALLTADTMPLPELMNGLRDLIQRARAGGLRGSELMNASATVTALGERGVDTVYGVIHPPQVAMIGFGRMISRPVAVDEAIAVHPVVEVTLAADHRVCDGHLGALFLNEITTQLQHPEDL